MTSSQPSENVPIPSWLKALLQSVNNEKSKFHCMTHRRTYFCIDCVSSICLECQQLHKPHQVIQIRQASYRSVVRKDDLSISMADIQPFIVNSHDIFFLQKRNSEQHARPQTHSAGFFCEICGWKLLRSFRFCSVECKDINAESLRQKSEAPPQSKSFRKRKRKGTPVRAPFF